MEVKKDAKCSRDEEMFMNFQDIVSFETIPNTRTLAQKGKGVITVVYSPKNGKRLEILPSLVDELQIENAVQLGLLGKSLIIGRHLPNIEHNFPVKDVGKKKVIYSSSLVKEVIEKLQLDFSERVSLTLSQVQLEECDGNMIARVWVEESDN